MTLAFRAWNSRSHHDHGAGEREAAASSVGTFINVGVAGAAVLIAGTGVLLGLGSDKRPLPDEVTTQLAITTAWLVGSIICGAISEAYLLTHLHYKQSVAEEPLVMTFATAQLVAMVIGAAFFTTSLFLL